MDVIKKEIKDEVTHILYDQTRRTPIVIPVINEIGGNNNNNNGGGQKQQGKPQRSPMPQPSNKKFPPKQTPDSEAAVPRGTPETPSY